MKIYRYRLEEDYEVTVPVKHPDVKHPYCEVENGRVTIKCGYSWDGCTPNFAPLKMFYLGTPNGIIDYRTGKTVTYYASLVHDCLCQYKIGTKRDADLLFRDMLLRSGWPMSRVYFWAVRIFGSSW